MEQPPPEPAPFRFLTTIEQRQAPCDPYERDPRIVRMSASRYFDSGVFLLDGRYLVTRHADLLMAIHCGWRSKNGDSEDGCIPSCHVNSQESVTFHASPESQYEFYTVAAESQRVRRYMLSLRPGRREIHLLSDASMRPTPSPTGMTIACNGGLMVQYMQATGHVCIHKPGFMSGIVPRRLAPFPLQNQRLTSELSLDGKYLSTFKSDGLPDVGNRLLETTWFRVVRRDFWRMVSDVGGMIALSDREGVVAKLPDKPGWRRLFTYRELGFEGLRTIIMACSPITGILLEINDDRREYVVVTQQKDVVRMPIPAYTYPGAFEPLLAPRGDWFAAPKLMGLPLRIHQELRPVDLGLRLAVLASLGDKSPWRHLWLQSGDAALWARVLAFA